MACVTMCVGHGRRVTRLLCEVLSHNHTHSYSKSHSLSPYSQTLTITRLTSARAGPTVLFVGGHCVCSCCTNLSSIPFKRNLVRHACVQVGDEVGLGTGESVRVSSKTRIAFYTYGFFKCITRSDPRLSRWAAVVLDEVGVLLWVISPGLHQSVTPLASPCDTKP
jgi:hypothetical protein